MKLLVLAPSYPHPAHPAASCFNEVSVRTLNDLCEKVELLVPRPFAPPVLSSLTPRWKTYASIVSHEVREGIPIHRPPYLQVPRIGGAFWTDPGSYFWCRRTARDIHRRVGFDAILSFDLVGAGGMAWRLAQDLGIPGSGWSTGDDTRHSPNSSHGRVLIRAIKNLDLVFYQSHELLGKAAQLLGISPSKMSHDKHVVLPRGILPPPPLPRIEFRNRMRSEWNVGDDQVVVLYIGRITRAKGIFELLEAVSLAASRDPRIVCLMLGSQPGFDDTTLAQKKLKEFPTLAGRIRILPACSQDKVWQYLCGADVFVLPSHNEGIPNSLLEAMAMGVSAIAFAIPPVLEIEAGTGGLLLVPPLNSELFSESILRLAASPDERVRIGEIGRRLVMDRFMARKNMASVLQKLSWMVDKHRSQH